MQKKIIIRRSGMDENVLPILQRIYALRGVQSEKELDRGLNHLLPFHDLLNIEKAVSCLADALRLQKTIVVIGDFDADGATSTALAVRALRSFGAKRIEFLVPNRFTFGYGLTPELVDMAYKYYLPDVIITVDNGIANHAGVDAANKLGIKVIITDHHLPAHTLPAAEVIVNPNQPHDVFPSKNLAGVGVIFYVMLALRRYLADSGWFAEQGIPEPSMSQFLDLIALGTVADVVPLDHNNRILVYQGLRRIRARQCIAGISALLEIAGRNQSRIVAADLGFAVAPRLNAAGRLDDMSLGINCLLSDDMEEARQMAKMLSELNDERRVIEQDMQDQAMHVLTKFRPQEKQLPRGICLFDEEWHQGVIGIVASRIKDRFHRPVIAFAPGTDTEIKGSARSIPGLHIRDTLAHIAVEYPGLINKFGGHAMAAGLTLTRDTFEKFSTAFDEIVSRYLTEEQLQNCVMSDGELHQHELTLELAETLREAGPWGQAFSEPLFDGVFSILEQRLVGNKHLKLVLTQEDQMPLDAIAFNIDPNSWPNYRCKRLHVAYRMDVNEFRGKRKLQLMVEHLEPL